MQYTTKFQHTAARRRLRYTLDRSPPALLVSTHSRPKAAAPAQPLPPLARCCFNTQPPEGGCSGAKAKLPCKRWFQHTAARRRLPSPSPTPCFAALFQHTAARRRLLAQRFTTPRVTRCFNTQPPEGGCCLIARLPEDARGFNTQPPEGGCFKPDALPQLKQWFQHTAARRRLQAQSPRICPAPRVSTHSRPKAAAGQQAHGWHGRQCFNTQPPEGGCILQKRAIRRPKSFNTQPPEGGCAGRQTGRQTGRGFNTQPPEGGCFHARRQRLALGRFNTQPPEGGCGGELMTRIRGCVSTHSRPKAAASALNWRERYFLVSTHSRPKAAAAAFRRGAGRGPGFNTQPPEGGCPGFSVGAERLHGFNTQPPEGGCITEKNARMGRTFQHTAARRRLPKMRVINNGGQLFQHTAARRRLHARPNAGVPGQPVSTHSRPKAAANRFLRRILHYLFQHTAARRRLPSQVWLWTAFGLFQHTAARRRLLPA